MEGNDHTEVGREGEEDSHRELNNDGVGWRGVMTHDRV